MDSTMKFLIIFSVIMCGVATYQLHAEPVKDGAKVIEEADTPFFFKEADLVAYYSKNFYFVKGDAQGLKSFEAFGMRIRWTSKAYEVTVISQDATHRAALIQFDKDFTPVWVNTDCLDNPETEETTGTITD
jgi:hypothetical protein